MFFKIHDIFFVFFVIFGTVISVSSNNWFTAWVGLEINLLSVTPLILNNLKSSLSEASIKYFLTQALASLFLIISSIFIMLSSNMISFETNNNFIASAILIKAGMIPFHFWFPQVIKVLSWIQCLILFTWQKIAPLVMISFLESKIILFSAIVSSFFGSLMGLNQNNIKLLMTFSSISHSGWMALSCTLKMNILYLYFSIYSFISLSLVFIFNKLSINKIKQLKTMKSNYLLLSCFSLNLLSLGGLPPLLGFLSKLPILIIIFSLKSMFIFFFFIFSSLVSLYFYTRMIYATIMTKSKNLSIKFSNDFILNSFLILSLSSNMIFMTTI